MTNKGELEVLVTEYASFSRRFIAVVLDFLILIVPCIIAGHIVPFIGGLIVVFFYAPVLECSSLRATIGKHLVGIQVVDIEQRRISFQSSLIRNVLKIISTSFFFLGHFVALFTRRHQSLHDMLSDTIVVYGRSEEPIVPAWTNSVRRIFSSKFISIEEDSLTKLERLQRLREKGAITEEEFLIQKKKILKNE